tara:strand:+ start:1170 stop:1343 length:174 start_codon:yes stop_codon:yes gene_type:complete
MDKDTTESIIVNGAAIGLSFTELEPALRLLGLIIGIAFTLYKFYLAYKNEKRRSNKD